MNMGQTNIKPFQKILENIKYKNSTFSLKRGEFGTIILKISTPVKCINTNKLTPVWMEQSFAEESVINWTEKLFLKYVHDLAQMWEEHECDEQFLYRGERIYDPHKYDDR